MKKADATTVLAEAKGTGKEVDGMPVEREGNLAGKEEKGYESMEREGGLGPQAVAAGRQDQAERGKTDRRCRNECGKCGRPVGAEAKRCARCKRQVYCCRDCQTSDWKRHKRECIEAGAGSGGSRQGAVGLGLDAVFAQLDNCPGAKLPPRMTRAELDARMANPLTSEEMALMDAVEAAVKAQKWREVVGMTEARDVARSLTAQKRWPETAAQILHTMGSAWMQLGQPPQAIEHFEQALEAVRVTWEVGFNFMSETFEREKELQVCLDLAEAYMAAKQWNKNIALLLPRLKLARDLRRRRFEARICAMLSICHMSLLQKAPALEYHTRAESIFTRLGDKPGLLTVYMNGGSIECVGPEEVQKNLQKAVELARELGEKDSEAKCLGNLGSMIVSACSSYPKDTVLNKSLSNSKGVGLDCDDARAKDIGGAVRYHLHDNDVAQGLHHLKRAYDLALEAGGSAPQLYPEEGEDQQDAAAAASTLANACLSLGIGHASFVRRHLRWGPDGALSWCQSTDQLVLNTLQGAMNQIFGPVDPEAVGTVRPALREHAGKELKRPDASKAVVGSRVVLVGLGPAHLAAPPVWEQTGLVCGVAHPACVCTVDVGLPFDSANGGMRGGWGQVLGAGGWSVLFQKTGWRGWKGPLLDFWLDFWLPTFQEASHLSLSPASLCRCIADLTCAETSFQRRLLKLNSRFGISCDLPLDKFAHASGEQGVVWHTLPRVQLALLDSVAGLNGKSGVVSRVVAGHGERGRGGAEGGLLVDLSEEEGQVCVHRCNGVVLVTPDDMLSLHMTDMMGGSDDAAWHCQFICGLHDAVKVVHTYIYPHIHACIHCMYVCMYV